MKNLTSKFFRLRFQLWFSCLALHSPTTLRTKDANKIEHFTNIENQNFLYYRYCLKSNLNKNGFRPISCRFVLCLITLRKHQKMCWFRKMCQKLWGMTKCAKSWEIMTKCAKSWGIMTKCHSLCNSPSSDSLLLSQK